MVEIGQIALFVLAGICLYGLVGFLFRDQLMSRSIKTRATSGNIVDMAVRHSGLERNRQ